MSDDASTPTGHSAAPGMLRRILRFLYEDRYFWIAIALVFALRLMPQAHFLAWPFTQFGTLVHELFHGLAGLAAGGDFLHMTVYQDGGGVAWTRTGNAWQRALTAAGGLVGPSILGAIILMFARRFGVTSILFGVLSFMFLVAAFAWAKGGYTVGLCLVVAALFFVVAIIPYRGLTRLFAMFVAIQLGFENLLDLDYMFIDSFERNGKLSISDTGMIARQLGGTFWMWGALIALFTFAIIAAALYLSAPAVKQPGQTHHGRKA